MGAQIFAGLQAEVYSSGFGRRRTEAEGGIYGRAARETSAKAERHEKGSAPEKPGTSGFELTNLALTACSPGKIILLLAPHPSCGYGKYFVRE